MDLKYDIQQLGNNRILFNEAVNVVDPFFLCVCVNPWTQVSKTLHIVPEGTDGEWILNIIGALESYQDLVGGEIYFEDIGTWEVAIYLNEVIDSALVTDVLFQVIDFT